MAPLRAEVLRFPQPDGGLDLVDLLFERVVRLGPEDAARVAAGDESLSTRADLLLFWEGPVGDSQRLSVWSSRVQGQPPAATVSSSETDAPDWSLAATLPDTVDAAWRDGERWRRLAEDRRAGRRYLVLRQFVAPDTARALRDQAAALPFVRFDSELVHAERRLLEGDELAAWRALAQSPAVRALLGGVLGVALPAGLVANAWRLQRGDWFGVHPDGRLYRGTVSLGLCDRWTADDGGAIAFGDPGAGGFVARERWLPQLGDVCVFAPDRTTFHAVETVQSERTRLSVTAWWVDP